MQKKMERFLASIGMSDPSSLDLDFEIVGRNPNDRNKVDMVIKKESPWASSELGAFQEGISTINYSYTLRFVYSSPIRFEDVDALFESWYFSHYRSIPPFQLTPGNENLIHVFLPESLKESDVKRQCGEFTGLLKWIGYPFSVDVLPETETDKMRKSPAETPSDDRKTLEDSSLMNEEVAEMDKEDVTPSPSDFEEAEEMQNEEDSSETQACSPDGEDDACPDDSKETEDEPKEEEEKEEPEESCLSKDDSSESDSEGAASSPTPTLKVSKEEEEKRQASLREAEAQYLENQKIASIQMVNRRSYRRGNYNACHQIEEIYSYPMGNVEFKGELFEPDVRPSRRGSLFARFGVGDARSAIYVRASESKASGMTAELLNSLKEGMMVQIRGAIEIDERSGDKIIFAHYLEILPPKPLRDDTEKEERVELHLHTKMSQMDGLGDIADYIKLAGHWGMKALAVTDHGVIQSFPAAETAAMKQKFPKIIYGIEFYAIDLPKYVYSPSPVKLTKAKYCVFDFETTGLSCRYDVPTEFGAVLVENGLVTRHYDTFINGGLHIPELIQNKTHITDEMIKDAPDIVTALKGIMAFIGDAILVSHNASFDIGFLNQMRSKAGLGPVTNPVVDTLALSHYLFPKAGRHTLGALSRNLGLEVYKEDEAHRADYDAEALNDVWQTIIPILTKDNPDLTHADLEKLVSTDQAFYKHLKSFHVCALAKNQSGIKALYRLVSESHTTYLSAGSVPKIPRFRLQEERQDLLLGSACFNGEVFENAMNKDQSDLEKAISFYDYIEVQPKENYSWLVNMRNIDDDRLMKILHSIIDTADKMGKMVCATGDCHYVNPEDKITRDVYICSQGLGGVLHPLMTRSRFNAAVHFPNPDQHFRSTGEMLESFRTWLPEEKCHEIVVKNTNLIADQISIVEILKTKLYTPDSNLPGSDEKIQKICWDNLHARYGEHPDEKIVNRLSKELHGIVSNGYSVTYYIANRLIEKASSDGYIVGSRGSVGSSFAATMANITEVNPLAPHYVCPKCHHFEWAPDPNLRSGFDLPQKVCPECGEKMIGDGQSIPFETFLGFNAEKVPDIDLNFPQDYQATAHAYTRTLLSTPEENEKIAKGEPISNPHVIRAGTIATAEEKNAFGYVKNFYYIKYLKEDWLKVNKAYVSYLASKCVGVKRTTGQHPGGIVVIPADMDIFDFTPYQHPADDPDAKWLTTHYEFASMHDSVLKLDELGHVDPMALRMMSLLTDVDIHSIPMDDPKVLSLFTSPTALGLKENPLNFKTGAIALPEFGTPFVQGLLEEAKPKTFNDLLIISGLSHGTNVWNSNAEDLVNGGKRLEQVIGCRDDIMNYLISMGVKDSVAFKIMEEVRHNKAGKPLKEETIKAMEDAKVPEWYIDSCKKIRYLFPRAHATAYVMGAVRVAWFKVYRALEFYATYFSTRCKSFDLNTIAGPLPDIVSAINELKRRSAAKIDYTDTDDEVLKTDTAAAEMIDRGFVIENVNVMESDPSVWTVCKERNSIIPPFTAIGNFGIKPATGIMEARKDGPFISIEDLKRRAGVGDSAIKALKEHGALEGLGESNQMSLFDFNF